MADETAASADIMGGLSDGGGESPGAPSQGESAFQDEPEGAGAPAQAAGEQPDELDAALDAWEKGETPGSGSSRQNDPLGGLDPNHPVVRGLMRQAQEGQMQQVSAKAARDLVAAGIPSQLVPELIEMFSGVRQLQDNYNQLAGFVQQLDQSKFVTDAKANQLARKYEKYGVTAEMLTTGRPKSAQEMENLAISLAIVNRKNGVRSRAKRGQDNFEDSRQGSGSGTSDYMDLTKPALGLLTRGIKR